MYHVALMDPPPSIPSVQIMSQPHAVFVAAKAWVWYHVALCPPWLNWMYCNGVLSDFLTDIRPLRVNAAPKSRWMARSFFSWLQFHQKDGCRITKCILEEWDHLWRKGEQVLISPEAWTAAEPQCLAPRLKGGKKWCEASWEKMCSAKMNLVQCNCPWKELLCNQPNSLKASTLYYVNGYYPTMLCEQHWSVSLCKKKKKEN